MNATKDMRLVEALDYIDEEYITSAAKYKMHDKPVTQEPPAMTWKTPFKHWKQFVALAACLILLSMASPIVNYVVEAVRSFSAGWGSEITEETSDMHTLSDTETNNDSFTEFPNTTAPVIIPPDPDYLRFISDLEPITQEEMLAVNDAWDDVVYHNVYQSVYQEKIRLMSEEEAAKIADERATQLSLEYSYAFFNYWRFNLYGYIGKIADYIILLELNKDGVDDEDMIIGEYNTGDHRWYAYKDGAIYSLKDIYENGNITDEQLDIIANRMEQYLVASYNYYPSNYEKTKNKN